MIAIAIASDHRGFLHKQYIIEQRLFAEDMVSWIDLGAFNTQRSDYPIFAQSVCRAILDQQVQFGVLLCGSGIGMSIAANRFNYIYAALAWNEDIARISREHDCANILVLPADYISYKQALEIVRAWFLAKPLLDEHKARLELLDTLV